MHIRMCAHVCVLAHTYTQRMKEGEKERDIKILIKTKISKDHKAER